MYSLQGCIATIPGKKKTFVNYKYIIYNLNTNYK